MAQDFGFVGPARARGNTRCISSSRAGATEPKDKPAVGQYASGAALVHDEDRQTLCAARSVVTHAPRHRRQTNSRTCADLQRIDRARETARTIRVEPTAERAVEVLITNDGRASRRNLTIACGVAVASTHPTAGAPDGA